MVEIININQCQQVIFTNDFLRSETFNLKHLT